MAQGLMEKKFNRDLKTGVPGTGYAPKHDPTKPAPIVTPTPALEPVVAEPVAQEPEKKVTVAPKEKKPVEKPLIGIRNWKESVGGVAAERMQSCIIYHLDISKDKWWCPKINSGRGFLKSGEGKIARLLSDSVPEDFKYELNGVIGWRSKPVEDSDDRFVEKYIKRQPRSEAERESIRAHFGITKYSRKFLKKKDCKKCNGTGFCDVYPYVDNPKLSASVQCSCIEE